MRGVLRRALGPLDVFVGLQWRTIFQTVEGKTDPLAQAAGYTTKSDYIGFGTGPTAGLSWRTSLGRSGYLGIEGQSTLLMVKEGDQFAFRLSGGAGAALRMDALASHFSMAEPLHTSADASSVQ